MDPRPQDAVFAGSIPAQYEAGLGPVIFAPYADDLARRIAATVSNGRLLETACGTGMLTRRLAAALPKSVHLVATDLNEGMLAHAQSIVPASPRLEWKVADAAALPFPDAAFGALVCQFGWMFIPDKERAFREAHRVLAAGGRLFFSVWCRIEENRFAAIAHTTVAKFFGAEPPTFYQVPFGFHDEPTIRAHLRNAGFADVACERVTFQAKAPSLHVFARGLVEGNPIANAIRDAKIPFARVVDAVTDALRAESGGESFSAPMSALVWSARKA